MPPPVSRSRSAGARARSHQSSLRRLLVADALRSWVPPTAAVVILALSMLLDSIGLVADRTAAAIAVVALLVLGAFVIVSRLLADDAEQEMSPALAVGLGVLWVALLTLPFEARLFPGTPLRQLPLDRTAKGAVLAAAGEGSRFDLVLDAHLPIASERRDRTVHYDLDVVDEAGTHARVAGELGDSWRMRRLGRRGSAPSHIEHLSAEHTIDDAGRGALRVADVTVTGEPATSVVATLYGHHTPPALVLYTAAVALVLGAVALDLWWDPRATATATLVTAGACAAALVFVGSGAGHPGIRDVIGATLAGAVIGVPAGAVAAWMGRTLVLRNPGKARRAA